MRGPYLSIWQGLVILALVVVSFGSMLTYTQRNNAEARLEIKQMVWDNCEMRRANVLRSNARNAELASIERANPVADPTVRDRRVALYSVMLDVPECGRRP